MGTSGPRTPGFAWSHSRARRFRECRRRHFWAVYGGQGGWHHHAAPGVRLAWLMGRLLPSWAVAVGQAVHRRALACARAAAFGELMPSFVTMRRTAARELNGLFQQIYSPQNAFESHPERWPMLEAHFYGEPGRPEELERAVTALDDAIRVLAGADDLWARVRASGPASLWVPEPFFSFEFGVERIRVYAAPDLVVGPRPGSDPTNSAAEIWDFKLRGDGGAVDQLLVYGLALAHGEAFPPGPTADRRYLGRIVRLGAAAESVEERATFAITAGDLHAAAARIHEDTVAMRALLRDPARNIPRDVEAFPRTEQAWRCARCAFRGLCDPAALAASRIRSHPFPSGALTGVSVQ